MPTNLLPKLAGLCGSTHVWILLVNLIIVGITCGVLWGTLTDKVDNLREMMFRERGQQLNWNAEERRQDDIHRERVNAVQSQLFELLVKMKNEH